MLKVAPFSYRHEEIPLRAFVRIVQRERALKYVGGPKVTIKPTPAHNSNQFILNSFYSNRLHTTLISSKPVHQFWNAGRL